LTPAKIVESKWWNNMINYAELRSPRIIILKIHEKGKVP